MKVGFIGLGSMGRPMAANLARAGFSLQTYDLNRTGSCASPAEAARGAQILITMLPDGKAVRKAVRAALPGIARGCVVVDMSSSDPSDTRALGAELKKRGVALLDAPVSGAVAKARDGTLSIMAGGEAAALERVRPVLAKLGTQIFHAGALGAGHATKALNNYLGAAGTIAGMEALLVGRAFGLEPKIMLEIINASTGRNSATDRKIPQQVLTNAFASGFSMALMAKDVGIAAQLARGVGVPAPYLRKTLSMWRDALGRLPAGADHTEMYRYLEKLKLPSRAAASPRRRSHRRRRRST